MQNDELEEKVTMMEELIQGFVQRMTIIEAEIPEFLKSFLKQYKETLDKIVARIEISNKRYDDGKIQQQIDEVKKTGSNSTQSYRGKKQPSFRGLVKNSDYRFCNCLLGNCWICWNGFIPQ